MTFKQADETLLHVNHVANSQYSFYTTTDGRVLLRDSVGNLCYAKQIGNQLINTGIAAHEEGWQSENERSVKRTAAKLSNVLNSLQTKRLQALQRDSSLKTPQNQQTDLDVTERAMEELSQASVAQPFLLSWLNLQTSHCKTTQL